MAVVQKIRCRVEEILDHGNRVYTVFLKPERLLPHFRPGQFLNLALDEYDPSGFWPDSRAFSIASSPAERDQLTISYSVKGCFTSRMEKELAEGRPVWVKLPYGDFIIEAEKEVVLLAGGTGITAFTAFIGSLQPGRGDDVYLAYGARRGGLLTYREMIDKQAGNIPALQVFYFVEETCRGRKDGQMDREISGSLSIDALWPRLKNPLAADYYLSGPPAMLKGLSGELLSRGIKPESVRMDAWE